ncbi:GDCCVxC domain-containing (seleno)protein [Psychromonas aquimarina]|uniref:GDCCVxC domain-containing (seleno)protein n=1 Tax=Psychromonas aquimarina TaxID=444919 RepID=UPI000A001AB4|nr:GDCCVxC domain-containing (seleno)protein [Psychromonas aquimarina]
MCEVILQSKLTCPFCGFQKNEVMPVDACLYFYECTCCKKLLKPKAGDCCVFCSYGTVQCPPVQQHKSCCRK